MAQLYGLGMEHKALGAGAVDVVTNDGGVQTLSVGGMYTKLVGATRNGVEAYACAHAFVALDPIDGVCRTAILGDHLAWAVVVVELQG